jgi:oxygen-independent coproporphyrinogen-3 oxidase
VREAGPWLYVHVPFCAVPCTYCDFSKGTLSGAKLEHWLRALEREAVLRAPSASGVAFRSVFFGGGTPSAISSRHFRRLDAIVRGAFTLAPGAEITLEANPETAKPTLLETWVSCGVNRLSMGAQSFEPDELATLGRVHGASRAAEAVRLARAAGFRRVSLDLMFGYPGHDAARFARTLDRALDTAPEHLSVYCFIPEAGTPLGDAVLAGGRSMPGPDEQAAMYGQAMAAAAAAGLAPYETSNFARPDEESRHNLAYWLRRDGLGLGPSAHGLWAGERYGNIHDAASWALALERGASPESERERPDAEAEADEIVLLGLRLGRGLAAGDHPPETWARVERRYGRALAAAVGEGRLERTATGVRVAPRHRFVADDVVAWLAARADSLTFDALSERFLDSRPCSIPPFPAT